MFFGDKVLINGDVVLLRIELNDETHLTVSWRLIATGHLLAFVNSSLFILSEMDRYSKSSLWLKLFALKKWHEVPEEIPKLYN